MRHKFILFLVGRIRFESNSNGYGKAEFMKFNQIFENGFYDQTNDLIKINVYVQVDYEGM